MPHNRMLLLVMMAACAGDDAAPAGTGTTGSSTGVAVDSTGDDGVVASTGETQGVPATTSGGTSTSGSADSTTAEPRMAAISEIDCHGRDAIEIATASGVDLSGVEILIGSELDYVLPPGSISEGLFVVREAKNGEPGLTRNIGCDGEVVALRDGGTILDETTLPAFPGSFKGTSWCSGVSPQPFDLCTPTIGDPNLAYVDPGPILFDPLAPVEIDLTIDQAGLDALTDAPFDYVEGTFSLTKDGSTTDPMAIGIALKGSLIGSFDDLSGKAAFKLRFDWVDPDGDFLGLAGLKLNNMNEDGSQMHEALAYELFAVAGVAAPRAGYAEVRVNGESYGLHATIERVDDVWASRFYPSTQHLYEGTFGLDVEPGRESEFFVDEGDDLDRSDLTALIAVGMLDDAAYYDGLQSITHLDAVLRMWAASQWLGHWDGYAAGRNNYELHSDDAGIFDFVPSGLDQTQEMAIDLRDGQSFLQPQGLLYARCLEDPTCSASYDAAVTDVGTALAAVDILDRIEIGRDAIEPYVAADPRRHDSVSQVHAAQNDLVEFWIGRAALFP